MSLTKYAEKRDFNKTGEPKAGKSKSKTKLMFVIQKHDASRLHYDFRLEMDGVLKSWAVPKGPSTDPKTKRLAMMVEDHPFDYKDFEGIIPKGEYGGGTVIVWDEGTYEPIEQIKGKKAQEKHLLKQLKDGSVKIVLHGEKLKGEFALVKTHGMGENGWLLIKHKDDYASVKDITKLDKSVLSGKTIAAMEKTGTQVWKDGHEEAIADEPAGDSEKKAPAVKKSRGKKTRDIETTGADRTVSQIAAGKVKKVNVPKLLTEQTTSGETDVKTLLKKAPKAKIPIGIKPMLATLVDDPFDDEEWLFEVKWDGYRAMAFTKKDDVQLLSRNNKPFNEKFYPIYDILKGWSMDAVLDGEILVVNDKGISNFGNIQNWRSEADGNLVYYVFDLLWYDGKDLRDLPLTDRQAILKEILPEDHDQIRISKSFAASGKEFFAAAQKMGLEGIIAKKANSTYLANSRSSDWLKVKVQQRQEVVIAGFTKNADTSKQFSALLLGVYEDGILQYVGKVGTGFSDKLQKEMIAQFKPLVTEKSPFEELPDINKPSRFRPNPPKAKATWLKPELVCEVAFTEVTSDGVFRHPSFKGMRVDKKATAVTREIAVPTEEVVEKETEQKVPEKKSFHTDAVTPPKSKERKTLLNPKDETQVRQVCGHDLKFTHLSKVYWPEDNVTKRDMFNYYYQIADYILPYLKDRPMSLNRFPGGINSKGFYQKDVTGKAPEWAKTFAHTTDEGKHNQYLLGDDEATLLWMASLGCIEMNPWFSRAATPDSPDYCVIDLDPDKSTTFDQVIEAALEVKKVLDEIGVPAYCKTSGSTGIHIYIPLEAAYTYDQSQMFARMVVNYVNEQLPDFTSVERMIADRKGKMYLDFLQNRPGATIACPYSLRPKPGATVSMPLHWDEVKPGLKMRDFTIFNAADRLKETGDLFKGVLGKGIDLANVLTKAKNILG
jgi:bifunctional non-homologous end joining protein LigD